MCRDYILDVKKALQVELCLEMMTSRRNIRTTAFQTVNMKGLKKSWDQFMSPCCKWE